MFLSPRERNITHDAKPQKQRQRASAPVVATAVTPLLRRHEVVSHAITLPDPDPDPDLDLDLDLDLDPDRLTPHRPLHLPNDFPSPSASIQIAPVMAHGAISGDPSLR